MRNLCLWLNLDRRGVINDTLDIEGAHTSIPADERQDCNVLL